MNLKVEHAIIAFLLLVCIYWFYKHNSLVNNLISNKEVKATIAKHNINCLNDHRFCR